MATRNYSNSPGGQTQYQAQKEFLTTPEAHVFLDQAYTRKKVDRRMGKGVNFRRMFNFPIDDSPTGVVEGVSPASQNISTEDYQGSLTRYAEVYELSRENYDLSPYDEVTEGAKQLRIKVDRIRERIRYNAAKAGSGVLYNSSTISSRATVNGLISLGRLQRAIADIKSGRWNPFTGIDTGSTKVGTTPLEASYLAFCSSDLEPDLRNIPGFTVTAFVGSGAKYKGEFGAVQNIRFITNADYTPFADAGAAIGSGNFRSTSGTSGDVYPIIIVAKDALHCVDLAGAGMAGYGNGKVNILDKADKSDPTNERIVLSADWYDLCMVTANAALRRIEVLCTANPT